MTYRELYNETKSALLENGIEFPDTEASILIENFFGMNRQQLIINRDAQVSDTESYELLLNAVVRRVKGEPLQYIIGHTEFHGHKFVVGQGVLIPRDDTEVVVCVALDYLKNKSNPTVADLCTGSGAIGVSIAKEIKASVVYGIEKSDDAYYYLEKNIKLNSTANVRPVKGNIFDIYSNFPDESFDLIVSNPPYVETDVIPTLQEEIQYEPKSALDGGADGLDFYRKIIDLWTDKLKHNSMLAFEIGENQENEISGMLLNKGYKNIKLYKDIQNINRVITGIKNKGE